MSLTCYNYFIVKIKLIILIARGKNMKKIIILAMIFITLLAVGCTVNITAEDYRFFETSSQQTIDELVELESGTAKEISFEIITDALENPRLEVTSIGDEIELLQDGMNFTLSHSGEGDGELAFTLLSDNADPVNHNIKWTCKLLTQEVKITPIEESDDSILSEDVEINEEFIEGTSLYGGSKLILKERLKNGEELNSSDITEQIEFVSYEENELIVVVGESFSFEVEAVENSVVEVSGDSDIIEITSQEGVYTATAKEVGVAKILVTTQKEHYSTALTEIEVIVMAPPIVLIPQSENVELEIGTSSLFTYAVYPETTEITTKIMEEGIATANHSGSEIVINALAVGETELKINANAEGFTSAEVLIPLNITPTKAGLALSSQDLIGQKLNGYLMQSYQIGVVLEDGATLSVDYPAEAVTVSTDNGITITPITEGEFEIKLTAEKEGYYPNEQTILLTAKKLPVNLTLSTKEVAVNDLGLSANVTVGSSTENAEIEVFATEGVTANYSAANQSITISGSEDGIVTVTASSEGYENVSEQINVVFSQPSISLNLGRVNVALNGTSDVQNVTATASGAPSPEIKVSATEGINASYNSQNGVISISGSRDGSVTVTSEQAGYKSDSRQIVVTYNKPIINAYVSNANVSVYGADDEVEFSLSVSNAQYADVDISTTAGAKAIYYENGANGGVIRVSSDRNATLTLTVSAEGYTSVSTVININYYDKELPLSVGATSITAGEEAEFVWVDTGSVTGVDIEIKTSGNVDAYYSGGEIEITSGQGGGSVTVIASKDGYQTTQKQINVKYLSPSETPPADTAEVSAYESEVVRLINAIRIENGLDAFGSSSNLNYYADIRANDLLTSYSHDRPNGDSFYSIFSDTEGNNTYGENIAQGYRSAASVVDGWMNSAGHKKNILNPDFQELAVGVSIDSDGTISWVQLFWGRIEY